jgi:hypothetical protein
MPKKVNCHGIHWICLVIRTEGAKPGNDAAGGGRSGDPRLGSCYQVKPVVTLQEEKVQGVQGWVAAARGGGSGDTGLAAEPVESNHFIYTNAQFDPIYAVCTISSLHLSELLNVGRNKNTGLQCILG